MNKVVYLSIGALVGALATGAAFMTFLAFPQITPDGVADITGAPALTEAELDAEDDFLRIDMGKEDAPVAEIKPLKNSGNVRYLSCEKTPELVAYLGKQGTSTYARRRDMNYYLITTSVLATQDCTCTGKMIPVETLMAFEARLMEETKVTQLKELETGQLRDEGRVMQRQAEELCGGGI